MDSLLTLEELLRASGGRVVSSPLAWKGFSSVATDSRQVAGGAMFVPLVGENQDGHKYAAEAIEKGASVVLAAAASRALWQECAGGGAYIIEVDNTLHALQAAARAYIGKFPALTKIGITGSNGKTTTKEMVSAVLRKKYNTVNTQGNLNSETGVPLSVFSLLPVDSAPDVAVFEMGMNRVGEIGESAAVVQPQIALVTNIGTAHIGILGSRDAIAQEKRKIFGYTPPDGAAFIPHDDDYAAFLKEGVKGKVVEFGFGTTEGFALVKDRGIYGLDIMVGKVPCRLSLTGRHNLFNAASAVALGRHMGIADEEIASALESLQAMEGRGAASDDVIANGAKVVIVRDYYNANPQSMAAALDVCDKTECKGKKIYVLGDMKETDAEASHRDLGRRAAASNADEVIFVGEDVKYAYEEIGGKKSVYFVGGNDDNAMRQVASIILRTTSEGDMILLKASRSLMLERAARIITGGEGNKE